MNEINTNSDRDAKFWTEHVLKAESSGKSNQEYCRQFGLTKSTFSAYKKRLGLTKTVKRRAATTENTLEKINGSAFVEILTQPGRAANETDGVRSCRETKPSRQAMPDPEWLAEFLSAWNRLT